MKRFRYTLSAIVVAAGYGLAASSASAVTYGGIDFPQGDVSFADEVITYDWSYSGGAVPFSSDYTNPADTLGPPNYSIPTGSFSLGRGGMIELLFTDNLLSNSGDGEDDLHVFEIGPQTEWTDVYIRPLAETAALIGAGAFSGGYHYLGTTTGGTSSLDVDSVFTGYAAGQLLFDAVRLVDVFDQGGTTGGTVGADIDAVGAIFSAPPPPPQTDPPTTTAVPEPATAALGLLGTLGLIASLNRRRR